MTIKFIRSRDLVNWIFFFLFYITSKNNNLKLMKYNSVDSFIILHESHDWTSNAMKQSICNRIWSPCRGQPLMWNRNISSALCRYVEEGAMLPLWNPHYLQILSIYLFVCCLMNVSIGWNIFQSSCVHAIQSNFIHGSDWMSAVMILKI